MADINFSELNQELESLITDLQTNDLDIDQVIKKYERGIILIDQLEKHLLAAENKIKKLSIKNSKNK